MLFGCGGLHENGVPSGYIDKEEHFQENGAQDYTDYCKYTYDSSDDFVGNKEYKQIDDKDIGEIKPYFNNFESWMVESGRKDEYDFDENWISSGDYIKITYKIPNDKFADYTIYFFDMESLTLYYFHNNI